MSRSNTSNKKYNHKMLGKIKMLSLAIFTACTTIKEVEPGKIGISLEDADTITVLEGEYGDDSLIDYESALHDYIIKTYIDTATKEVYNLRCSKEGNELFAKFKLDDYTQNLLNNPDENWTTNNVMHKKRREAYESFKYL